jgi:hypothetical protein
MCAATTRDLSRLACLHRAVARDMDIRLVVLDATADDAVVNVAPIDPETADERTREPDDATEVLPAQVQPAVIKSATTAVARTLISRV